VKVRSWIVGLGLAAALSPAQAIAHAGGRAQLYVASATLAPQGEGWAMSTVLRDLDSGRLEPGFAVEASGTGPSGSFGPVALADAEGDGRYDAALPSIAAGNWMLTVRASEIPGGASALPLRRTWNVTLQPGQPVNIAGDGPSGSGKDSATNAVPLALGIGGAAGLALLAGIRRGRHRRAMVPAP
jgi:hypothetical protein